jgi:hypothetical protein
MSHLHAARGGVEVIGPAVQKRESTVVRVFHASPIFSRLRRGPQFSGFARD